MLAIITVGISASGKTHWANEFLKTNQGWANINRDDARADIMYESGLEPLWKNWKWKWEDKVTNRIEEKIQRAIDIGQNLIISDTNLHEERRGQLCAKLRLAGYLVNVKHFNDITWDEAVRRDTERHNGVGYAVIQKQWQQYLDTTNKRVVQNSNLPKAAIVDIDGTVALMNGNRGPFEWHRVHEDESHQPIIDMVHGLANAGYVILFTSGRDSVCFNSTYEWLDKRFPGVFWRLFMRLEKDMRKDTVVKEEIFREFILPNYHVVVAIDDRPCVARLWRDLGLNVVQVGNPYLEF